MEPRHSRIVAHSCLFLPLRPLGAGALPVLTLDGHGNRVVPRGAIGKRLHLLGRLHHAAAIDRAYLEAERALGGGPVDHTH